jgi:hypothetical protein
VSEADVYVARWLARDPARELMQLFTPPHQRRLAALWGALQLQLDEAAFELSEASVAQAKLAWWSQELADGARGAGRHPLVREWFGQPAAATVPAAAWTGLVQPALQLAQERPTPRDLDELLQRHASYGAALAQVETALFGAACDPLSPVVERLARQLDGPERAPPWVPLQLLARHQVGRDDLAAPGVARALRRDLAAALLPLLAADGGAAPRRMQRALDGWRLRHWSSGAGSAGPRPLRRLWLLWRAARQA